MSTEPERFDDRPTIGERPLEAIAGLVAFTFVGTLSLLTGGFVLLVMCCLGAFLCGQHLYELATDGERYRQHRP